MSSAFRSPILTAFTAREKPSIALRDSYHYSRPLLLNISHPSQAVDSFHGYTSDMPSPELSVRAKDYTRIITIRHCRKAPKAEKPDFTTEGSKAAAAPFEVLDVLRGDKLRLGAPEVVGPVVGDVMVLPPATEVSAGDD